MVLLSKRKFGNNFGWFGRWPSYSEFLITSVNLKKVINLIYNRLEREKHLIKLGSAQSKTQDLIQN